MFELKSHVKGKNYLTETEEQIILEINHIGDMMSKLNLEKEELKKKLLELRIAPFKLGGYALVEVPSGRGYKWQKCLLECKRGELYVTPFRKDGELSNRSFNIYPHLGKTYSDFLKEVTE